MSLIVLCLWDSKNSEEMDRRQEEVGLLRRQTVRRYSGSKSGTEGGGGDVGGEHIGVVAAVVRFVASDARRHTRSWAIAVTTVRLPPHRPQSVTLCAAA